MIFHDYVSLIHGGITGFLVSSSNFTSFPKDTGLLMSTDYDYFVWIRRSKHCTCIACTHFLSWADGNKDTSRMNVLIDGLKGAKHKVTHYIESSNKLIVAYTKANTDAGYQMIAIYSGSLNNVQMINTFSNEQGFIKGLFHLSGRMYYIAERMLGTFDPSAMTFTAEPDRPLAKGAKVYGEKSLLNLQDLFGCLTSEQDEQPQEFSNFNTVNIWLNVVLGAVNSLLIGGIIVFCFLIFQPSHLQESRSRHHQNPRNTRSDR
ncbi:hypothetical protein TYRP_017819 [Tyrophagus putrescentiae]|nr:hypothetical protein TYRP_017819 [Tyrophagus putrescentiae]